LRPWCQASTFTLSFPLSDSVGVMVFLSGSLFICFVRAAYCVTSSFLFPRAFLTGLASFHGEEILSVSPNSISPRMEGVTFEGI